jgi:hypothetical protein
MLHLPSEAGPIAEPRSSPAAGATRPMERRHVGHQSVLQHAAKRPRPPDVQVPRPPDTAAPRRLDIRFDLTQSAESRQTLRLTEAEFRKLGMVQGTVSELLDVTKVDKNDIIRAAVHRVFEEFDKTGSESDLVKRLRRKYR